MTPALQQNMLMGLK